MQAINQNNLFAFELTLYILQSPFATYQAQNAGNRLLKELTARLTPEQIIAVKVSAQTQSFDQIVEKVAHLATG
jgi:hypothetical protein